LGVGDFRIDSAGWSGADAMSRGAYVWDPQIYQPANGGSWSVPYQAIYFCNVVLTGIGEVATPDSATVAARNAVRGSALFIRALLFYYLEETFGQPYRPASAATDPGIPLRIGEDPTVVAPRATVRAVFDQIDNDLKAAIPLLPVAVQVENPNRPCRSAAFGLLARSALTQQNYRQARQWADSSLQLYAVLADFNNFDSTQSRPFPVRGNPEVLFQSSAVAYQLQVSPQSRVDSPLYASYEVNDLRRVLFFSPASGGSVYFKGHYTGLHAVFSGIATDEIFLIRAESAAEMGDAGGALSDLNTLLSRRWRKGSFQPLTASSADAALALVIREFRKETLFRESRWADLRRLNQDPRFADTLKRTLGNIRLLPNSPRYTYLIPDEEIRLSGIAQNP
ncbi:MAG TPA: RagB/SusD family nutrient uptake outer membrane protein, partial [Puia sp.]|jgi:hypothetical protein